MLFSTRHWRLISRAVLIPGTKLSPVNLMTQATTPRRALIVVDVQNIYADGPLLIEYQQGIRSVGPSRTAVFTNLVAAFGVLLSAGLLGEQVLVSMLVGGTVSVIGVSLTNKK